MYRAPLGRLAEAAGDLFVALNGPPETEVTGLSYDSRKTRAGDLFFCIPGMATDGHRYAPAAVGAGAAALVVERPLDLGVPEIVVADARRAMPRLAAEMLGQPARDMVLLGVTGTNGKTTTAFLLESILRAEGRTTGLIGTIETRVAGRVFPGVRTTPESLDLQLLFADMRDAGVDAVAMEVTSHALALHRVEGLRFAAAGFTNLTQDHLDFHRDMEDYFGAKRSLFVPERTERAAVNIDDVYGRRLFSEAEVPCISFGTAEEADVRAVSVEQKPEGTTFDIVTPHGGVTIQTSLIGSFNVSNCLAAAAIAIQSGAGLGAVQEGIGALGAVPGRFEAVRAGQPFWVVVDYAHTPDSLDNVLRAARNVAVRSEGRVVCVFGCGGDRDKGKRPLMGGVAARLADVVIVTSDNPRSEDPVAIVDQILEGVVAQRPGGADEVLVDRAAAIAAAIDAAAPGDVVVIAGKGHETYQEFASRTIHFDDREVAREALAAAGYEG